MSQHLRKSNNANLSDRDESEIPREWDDYPLYTGEWGDLPEIPLDPEVDTHYWGFREDVSDDTDDSPHDSEDQPESIRSGSHPLHTDHNMREEKRHVDEYMCSKLQVAERKIQELQSKLQDMEKTKDNFQEKFNEVLTINTQMRVHQKKQDAKCTNLESQLQDMEEENQSLQKMVEQALDQKAKILKEKKELKIKYTEVNAKLEESERRHREVQPELEDTMEQNKSLLHKAQQGNADVLEEKEAKHREVLHKMQEKHTKTEWELYEMEKKNAQVLKENEQLTKSQIKLQDVLQDSKKRNRELMAKIKTLEQCKERLEKMCAVMQGRVNAMMSSSEGLEKLVKHKITELHKEKQRQEKMHQNMLQQVQRRCEHLQDMNLHIHQCNEYTQEAMKIQEKKYKQLEEKHAEKHQKIELLEIRCKKLEEENAENIRHLHSVILQHKELFECCLKKKKHFKFLQKNAAPYTSQGQVDLSATNFNKSP